MYLNKNYSDKNISLAVFFILIGYFFINLSFLSDGVRQIIAFSFFILSILFSLKYVISDFVLNLRSGSVLLGVFICLYVFIFSNIILPFKEYGINKYHYFLFVIVISFCAIPLHLSRNANMKLFANGLFWISLTYCFIAIVFADASLGRRSEAGLNPSILARIAMICGVYSANLMIFKGITKKSLFVVIFSVVAVLFTATKTPVPVFIFSLLIVYYRYVKWYNIFKYFKYMLVIIPLIFILIQWFVPKEFVDRVFDPKGLSVESQSVEGNRFQLYDVAIDVIYNNPLGSGFGGFAKHHSFIIAPHNIFLEFGVELGFVFMLLFMIWCFCIIKKIMCVKKLDFYKGFYFTLFFYLFLSSLFGGEITIQALLLYIVGNYILFYLKP
ncbi:O-antigen ligase family protein [Myroides odoratimimus]|uniref:O-antigen ligase family protein n=1 Tax=Myroides odoratimimus TaxID=76832 RepID=UPI002575A4DD|nr:O-antigen ligase family protein [Myroides odoratimimus]MDM1500005.1 O-antigen ligase family protein [Myroides odoratimimus]